MIPFDSDHGVVFGPTRMVRSSDLDALALALSKAQGKFEAVAKDASNPFFKSSYAPLPHVVAAATPILAAEGLAVWQGPDSDDHGELLWTIILHSSGQYLGSAMRMRPIKQDPQAQGSAITYARRYAYMAALGLVADEDDDGNAASDHKPAGKPAAKRSSKPAAKAKTETVAGNVVRGPDGASIESLTEIRNLYTASGLTSDVFHEMLSEAGVTHEDGATVGTRVAGVTQTQADWITAALREHKSKAAEKAADAEAETLAK